MENPHSSCKAVIFGFEGTVLTEREKVFFTTHNPLGFILFARNCESKEQVRALTDSLRALSGRDRLLILIDQEGGRVARLKPPHWRKAPPAGVFAHMAACGNPQSAEAVYLNARLIAGELHELGITVDCAPMCDVQAPGSHDIIGDRAFGTTPQQVTVLAAAMARGLLDGGVLPVLKHIPGHGRAKVDSHESLPIVDATLEQLRASDFVPFVALKSIPLAMTAHILYTAIDDKEVATLSPTAIRLIREEMGYDGLLMSDDLSMKALKGDFTSLTEKTIAAGCDLVLHCNGKMEEMEPVADACPLLSADALRRLDIALAQLTPPLPLDPPTTLAQLDGMLSTVG